MESNNDNNNHKVATAATASTTTNNAPTIGTNVVPTMAAIVSGGSVAATTTSSAPGQAFLPPPQQGQQQQQQVGFNPQAGAYGMRQPQYLPQGVYPQPGMNFPLQQQPYMMMQTPQMMGLGPNNTNIPSATSASSSSGSSGTPAANDGAKQPMPNVYPSYPVYNTNPQGMYIAPQYYPRPPYQGMQPRMMGGPAGVQMGMPMNPKVGGMYPIQTGPGGAIIPPGATPIGVAPPATAALVSATAGSGVANDPNNRPIAVPTKREKKILVILDPKTMEKVVVEKAVTANSATSTTSASTGNEASTATTVSENIEPSSSSSSLDKDVSGQEGEKRNQEQAKLAPESSASPLLKFDAKAEFLANVKAVVGDRVNSVSPALKPQPTSSIIKPNEMSSEQLPLSQTVVTATTTTATTTVNKMTAPSTTTSFLSAASTPKDYDPSALKKMTAKSAFGIASGSQHPVTSGASNNNNNQASSSSSSLSQGMNNNNNSVSGNNNNNNNNSSNSSSSSSSSSSSVSGTPVAVATARASKRKIVYTQDEIFALRSSDASQKMPAELGPDRIDFNVIFVGGGSNSGGAGNGGRGVGGSIRSGQSGPGLIRQGSTSSTMSNQSGPIPKGTMLNNNNMNQNSSSWRDAPRNFPTPAQIAAQQQQQMIHREPLIKPSANAWKPTKATDEHMAAIKKVKGVLNKLSRENFEKLSVEMSNIQIDSFETFKEMIDLIFDTALEAPHFGPVYADLCHVLADKSEAIVARFVDFVVEDGKHYWTQSLDKTVSDRLRGPFDTLELAQKDQKKETSFKRVLVNRCQKEFEREDSFNEVEVKIAECRKERDAVADIKSAEYETIQAKLDELIFERTKIKKRLLGNTAFIGELYKQGMLAEKVMHQCIVALLKKEDDPIEEDVECLCKLLQTVGATLESSSTQTKNYMNEYFQILSRMSQNHEKLDSRHRFMIQGVIEQRQNGWKARRETLQVKTKAEIHADLERQELEKARAAGRSNMGNRGSVGGNNSGRGGMMMMGGKPMVGGGNRSGLLSNATFQSKLPTGFGVAGSGSQDVRAGAAKNITSTTIKAPATGTLPASSSSPGPNGVGATPASPSIDVRLGPSGPKTGAIRRPNPLGASPKPATPSSSTSQGVSSAGAAGATTTTASKIPLSSSSSIARPSSGLSNSSGANPSSSGTKTPSASDESKFPLDVVKSKLKSAISECAKGEPVSESLIAIYEIGRRAEQDVDPRRMMIDMTLEVMYEKKEKEAMLLINLLTELGINNQPGETEPFFTREGLVNAFNENFEFLPDIKVDSPMSEKYLVTLLSKLIVSDTEFTVQDLPLIVQNLRNNDPDYPPLFLGAILKSVLASGKESLISDVANHALSIAQAIIEVPEKTQEFVSSLNIPADVRTKTTSTTSLADMNGGEDAEATMLEEGESNEVDTSINAPEEES